MSLCVVKGLVFYPVFEHVCPVVVLHVVRSDVLRLAAALQSQLSAVLVWVSDGERETRLRASILILMSLIVLIVVAVSFVIGLGPRLVRGRVCCVSVVS